MSEGNSTFTKEDARMLLNLGRKMLLNSVGGLVTEIQSKLNPNVRFARLLKAKYDALVVAGFSKAEAYDLALKAVESTLRQVTEKEEVGDEAR